MVVFNNLNSVLWKHHLVLLVTWDFSKFGCLIFKSATAQDFRLHGSELFPPAKKERHQLIVDVYSDKDSMIAKLMELNDRASEVSTLAKSLIRDLRQERPDEIQGRS